MFWHKDIGFRAVEERDLESLRLLRNDPSTWMFLTDVKVVNSIMQEEWYERMSRNSGIQYYTVVKRVKTSEGNEEGDFLGMVRTDEIDFVNRSMRIGCDIVPAERRKGYGTMVFKAVMKYAFDQLNMNRLWLCVLDNNMIARNLYKNVGFEVEGRYRRAIWRDGEWHDYIVMSILREEYEDRQGK